MRFASLTSLIVMLLLAGCAAVNGTGLVPGKSTAADVQALMGTPADKIVAPDGDSTWYYPRQPTGLQTFAVRIAPDGTMRSIEQRLTEQNLKLLVPGETTAKEARELIGPPWRTSHNYLQQRDVWDYRMYNIQRQEYNLFLQFSGDALLREVVFLQDYKVSGSRRGGK